MASAPTSPVPKAFRRMPTTTLSVNKAPSPTASAPSSPSTTLRKPLGPQSTAPAVNPGLRPGGPNDTIQGQSGPQQAGGQIGQYGNQGATARINQNPRVNDLRATSSLGGLQLPRLPGVGNAAGGTLGSSPDLTRNLTPPNLGAGDFTNRPTTERGTIGDSSQGRFTQDAPRTADEYRQNQQRYYGPGNNWFSYTRPFSAMPNGGQLQDVLNRRGGEVLGSIGPGSGRNRRNQPQGTGYFHDPGGRDRGFRDVLGYGADAFDESTPEEEQEQKEYNPFTNPLGPDRTKEGPSGFFDPLNPQRKSGSSEDPIIDTWSPADPDASKTNVSDPSGYYNRSSSGLTAAPQPISLQNDLAAASARASGQMPIPQPVGTRTAAGPKALPAAGGQAPVVQGGDANQAQAQNLGSEEFVQFLGPLMGPLLSAAGGAMPGGGVAGQSGHGAAVSGQLGGGLGSNLFGSMMPGGSIATQGGVNASGLGLGRGGSGFMQHRGAVGQAKGYEGLLHAFQNKGPRSSYSRLRGLDGSGGGSGGHTPLRGKKTAGGGGSSDFGTTSSGLTAEGAPTSGGGSIISSTRASGQGGRPGGASPGGGSGEVAPFEIPEGVLLDANGYEQQLREMAALQKAQTMRASLESGARAGVSPEAQIGRSQGLSQASDAQTNIQVAQMRFQIQRENAQTKMEEARIRAEQLERQANREHDKEMAEYYAEQARKEREDERDWLEEQKALDREYAAHQDKQAALNSSPIVGPIKMGAEAVGKGLKSAWDAIF